MLQRILFDRGLWGNIFRSKYISTKNFECLNNPERWCKGSNMQKEFIQVIAMIKLYRSWKLGDGKKAKVDWNSSWLGEEVGYKMSYNLTITLNMRDIENSQIQQCKGMVIWKITYPGG